LDFKNRNMKIKVVNGGKFKLDGGAMFGVVPKSMWNKLNPSDENNMCTWSTRLLYIETENRKILIDTGLGTKQNEKFFSHFYPHDGNLHTAIDQEVIDVESITDVFLTHLHFDHCGGALKNAEDGSQIPTFPNAIYWSNEQHFNWAYTPNDREKASFLHENFVPLRDQGRLKFIPLIQGVEWIPGIMVHYFFGHTDAMMVPEIILHDGSSIFYCADLLPSSYHVKMPYVMAYDIRPLKTLEEKKRFYDMVLSKEKSYLFFEHDPVHAFGSLSINEKGRYQVDVNTRPDAIHHL